MNTNNIKSYAPRARDAFIAATSKRAAVFGIRESSIPSMGIEPLEQKGDLALIGDRPFPASIIRPRAALVKKVMQMGFTQVMEQAAYSWFNRLCAIRYMELKGYLEHGSRVLSHPKQAGGFQILDECLNIDLPGLDKQRITELKLDGNQDEALYRELLLAQCHALHQAMPFLFEAIDDETELLLPDNLTKTDSLIRELVDSIPEEDWQNVEIIGWLYQFYISAKKDYVIGKVVKSEDIPAATQLFTPNWIVKYMVQNSLGAQWLATYPDSPLKAQMEYYIEPAEQTVEVNVQLAAIIPSTLDPEALTLIDPACGSGHILVEGYDLFKAIYLERGYRQREIPQLILEKNLFGLDIDDRATQLSGFALMMKGRADDRRLFERGVKLNVMALVNSSEFDAEGLPEWVQLGNYGLKTEDLTELKQLFEHATTFGSLIQVPEGLAEKLPALMLLSQATSQDLFVSDALKQLGPLVQQAKLLAAQYDAVVANPPYMGGRAMNALVKKFAKDHFPDSKSDLFACFIERGFTLSRVDGHNSMVTMQSWMFLSSFQTMRERLLKEKTIGTMAHLGARAFGSISGEVVQTSAFVLKNRAIDLYRPVFLRLLDGGEEDKRKSLAQGQRRFDRLAQYEFRKIPGSPIAYWVSSPMMQTFENRKLRYLTMGEGKNVTSDNARFVRLAWEISLDVFGRDKKWLPYAKGGSFRKWAGNIEHVVDWSPETRGYYQRFNVARIIPEGLWYREGITWTDITSGGTGFRYLPPNTTFDATGLSIFFDNDEKIGDVIGLLNSPYSLSVLQLLNPTFHAQLIDVKAIPVLESLPNVKALTERCIDIASSDWDAYERSWDFQTLPLLTASSDPSPTLESSYTTWITNNRETIAEMKRLEDENNRLFIDAYGLTDELTPDVPIEQITLTVNPSYRYGGKLTEDDLWNRFREDTMQELVSYAIGCIMGRYSLDARGLIYAHSGNEGFDASHYATFPADDDGILPFTDKEWFVDDAANRLVDFIGLAWDKSHLEDNLRFLADNLSPKKSESSRDTLRRYLCDSFFKDHLQTYKKRPIYWLFSSGKHKAFQCLVYLHRYNANTLARMRTQHVIPLSAKLNSYANKLEQDIDACTSTAEKKALEKELATLHNQQAELSTFDEKLRHYADQRIPLDLDDGVKVNYGKFGDLLAEVKAVTGDKAES